MEKFLATIFTIILTIWVLKWVLVLIGPWLLKLFAKRLMKKAGMSGEDMGGQPKSGGGTGDRGKAETVKNGKWWKTDEVILKPSRRHGERIADILGGEYIDYEEVEIGNQNK